MLLLALLLSCTRGNGLAPAYGHSHPVYGGTFTYADDDDIRTLDPAIAYDEVTWTAIHLVFDQLLEYDDDDQIAPGLAESWELSPDGRDWTFHLRHGVHFHNGREVTAKDVLYSWNRLFDPHLGSPAVDFFAVIDGAQDVLEDRARTLRGLRAPDSYTVTVHLTQPDRTFANAVAMTFGSVVPQEEVLARGEKWSFAPVGTGPFEVEAWSLGEKTIFAANRDYWKPGLPYLDRIIHLAHYPRSVQFLKLEAGELDQVNRLTSPDYLWIRSDPRWSQQLAEVPSIDTYGELMNVQMAPFDDVWFRRGVSAAIDRDKLAQLRNQRLRPTVSWVPPPIAGYVEWDTMSPADRVPYRYQRHDVALAKQCLAKSHYFRDGHYTGPPITYLSPSDEASTTTSQSIQQDLSLVGVPIQIKTTTFPTYLSAVGRPKTVQMAYTAWVMDYPDARNFLETNFACDNRAEDNSQNTSFYCDEQTDALLKRAAVEIDPDRRTALYKQAQARIAEAAPVAVEYHSSTISVTRPQVKGFRVDPIWTRDMSRAWLDVARGRPTPDGGPTSETVPTSQEAR